MSEQEQEQEYREEKQPQAIEDWPAPGGKLKALRLQQDLTQLQVADNLHLTVHYVNALEEDNYQKLPAKTFVKGYLRAYAGLMGADVEEILEDFENYTAARTEYQQQEIEAIRKRKVNDQSRLWLIGAAIIIVIFITLSWWYASRHDDGQSSQALPGTATTSIAQAPTADTRQYNNPPSADNGEDSDTVSETALIGSDDITLPLPGQATDGTGLTALDGDELTSGDAVREEAVTAVTATAEGPEPSAAEQQLESTSADESALAVDNAEVETTVPEPLFTINSEQTETGRIINLMSSGSDLLDIHFRGSSWIEVDNGDQVRLFNDILQRGDELRIQSRAPFNILVGDARQVEMVFNMEVVDVGRSIRSDNSARINLEP